MRTTMNTFSKLFTSLEALLGGGIGIVLSFISPIAPFFWLAVGLVLLDTITGMIAATRRKEKLHSRGFARVLSKMAVYMSAILACYCVEVVLKIQGHVTYFAVGAIAFTELMSVLENTRVVSGANIAAVVRGFLPGGKKNEDVEDETDSAEK